MTQSVNPQQQASSYGAFSQNPVPSTEQQTLPAIHNLVNPPNHGDAGFLAPSNAASHIPPVLSPASNTPHQAKETPQAQQPNQIRQTKGKYSLGDFSILRTLGTGSFGRVHLVQSKHNQRFYAVKVLKKAQVVKMKQVEHTNDERRMLQEVKHPFLITLWGTFRDAKNLYMVMDFVEGGELFSLLRKSQVSFIAIWL